MFIANTARKIHLLGFGSVLHVQKIGVKDKKKKAGQLTKTKLLKKEN
jgi:hypothetical protein